MRKIPLLALLLLASLAACTRTAKNSQLVDAPVELGPTKKDTAIIVGDQPTEWMLASLRSENEIGTADFLRLAEDLKALSDQQNNSNLERLSRRLVDTYREENDGKTSFSNSLYAEAMVGEGEPQVKPALDVVSRDLKNAINAVVGLLERSQTSFPWPKKLSNFSQAISTADAYTKWLGEKIPSLGLSPEMARPIQGAIKGEYSKLRPRLISYANSIEGSRSFAQAISLLKSAIKEFEVKLDRSTAAAFAQADELVASLQSTQSSQDALSLIIQVWRAIPPEDREAVFKEAAPEFYDFLKDKDELSLRCLESPLCVNPILEVAKRLVILPKINEFGVEKIKSQIDSAARDQLISTVLTVAVEMLPDLPIIVRDQALAQAKKYQDLIASVRKDFRGFAIKAFRGWEKGNFSSGVRAPDPSQIKIRIRGRDNVRVALPKAGKKGITSGAEVLGVSLALSSEFLPEKNGAPSKAALLDPINKILAVTGFRQGGGKLFPSLLLPIDGKRTENFDVKNLLQGKTTFAVPDSFQATADFSMDRGPELKANVSVGAQAELLRGISRQILFHRDWEKNSFDEVLGDIQVEDMVKEIPRGSVNFSAFPKDIIFTLAVGGAGAILQNVVRDLSPAFLILPNGKFLWGEKYRDIGEGEGNISTVAGLVNIENGVRGKEVRTVDVARYILALDEFLGAIEGIEQTKSPMLNTVGENGKSVLDELQEARRYLRLFQLALTNYLANVAQGPDGSFRAVYDLDTKSMVSGDLRLADQALAIRALVASSERLNLKLFTWAALDGFYSMNLLFWNPENQFYATSITPDGRKVGQAGLPEIAATLRAGGELTPHMNNTSRLQWERISRLWERALTEF